MSAELDALVLLVELAPTLDVLVVVVGGALVAVNMWVSNQVIDPFAAF
jgi:hypothetical protein